VEDWKYSFYRIPLYLKLSTPTKLKLELAMGGYYSFRGKCEVPEFTLFPVYMNDIMIIARNSDEITPSNDFGFFYSVGLAYPVAENFNIYLNGRYFSGRQTYIESVSATNGVAELTFGLGYSGLFKRKNPAVNPTPVNDSVSHSFFVTPKIGIAISGNSGADNNNMYTSATGLSAGLSFKYLFSKHFALQSELLYEQKGYKLKGESNSLFKYTPGTYYSLENNVDLGYITIPLLLNLRLGEKLTTYFNAGFYASMRMNARCTGTAYKDSKIDNTYKVYKITVYDDIDGFIKSNDWGWILGGGFQYPVLKKYKLDFEYRYASGFTNIYSNYYNYEPLENEDTQIKNKALTFSLGLQIPIN
jgi:opacity protein-like surface antigen